MIFLLLFFIVSIQAGLLPSVTQSEHKARVLDTPLSHQEHFQNLEHNAEYDHEAFLGVDEAKTFDQLSPEESRRRLGLLFHRIDADKNGTITEQELKDWIKSVQNRYITKDVERQWQQMNNDSNPNEISWEEYDKTMYHALYDTIEETKEMKEQYLRLQKKDRRRFLRADLDQNGRLNKAEFTDFLHPEQSARMKDLVVLETIEDMDGNGDGMISAEEYIRDMWDGDESNEPDWVKTERENFQKYRDLDHDGKLNLKEVELWLMPTDYDNIQAETVHLFREADQNEDHQLTKEEILAKYDVFVGSQATDWGADLNRHEDL